MPLIALDGVSMAYGHLPLVDQVMFQAEAGERVALIGRNGTGKSTLLRILSGELTPDAGTIWRAPDLRSARLVQDASLSVTDTVFEVVAQGLGDIRELVTAYHAAAVAVADRGEPADLERLGRLQHELDERDGWRVEQRIELVLTRLGLAPDVPVDTLSGGWRRRVLLARALVADPQLLLLDEPTNHLDIEAITWLEAFLADFAGALVFVTHDRAFLERLATRVIELDRGRLTSWPGSYTSFVERRDAALEAEAAAAVQFDKRLAKEEAWLRRGVKARRTRDEGRVRALLAMREARAARRTQPGDVRMDLEAAERSGRMVFEADGVTKAYGGRVVVRDWSTRIMRGDRVGLIGANGSGKTTALRLLLGETTPDSGEIRTGANVQTIYFDQQRETLDPERSVADTVADGNDTIALAGGGSRHVYGYLEDFLFPPERARSPVKALSGGERGRLLLARLFTRPANVLVLDEPTNDLDIETLQVLEARLLEFSGTILLVSHDRRFLNNVVTSTLVFEGDGRIEEYVGGYDDWLRQRDAGGSTEPPQPPQPAAPAARASASTARPKRLSYREERERQEWPARIEALEAERADLETRMADPAFYKEEAAIIQRAVDRLNVLAREIDESYRRWENLEAKADTHGQ